MKRVSPAGVAAAARVSASRQSVTTSRRSFGSSAYLRRTRRSSARSPLTTMCWAAPLSCSKSTSQIQETSCPSAIRSLRAIKNERAFPNWIAVRRTSLNPVGFLASNRTAGRSPGLQPLGRVLRGAGNNGEDGYEGVVRGNVFGTYLHGSLLPKNPHFSDLLIERALQRKGIQRLAGLASTEELAAHQSVSERVLGRPASTRS